MESCVDVPVDWHEVPELESEIPDVEAPDVDSMVKIEESAMTMKLRKK
uniref:Uncharacterized protein n=1 Tax=Brassica campestris TaxID=3711 RepID=A0A3P5YB46_BRACM|nr:unnamed protein product [Brassica rapa]